MTSKDRLYAALHGKKADHIPFSPFLAYVWENFPEEIKQMGQLEFHKRIGADPLWRGAPCPVKFVFPPAYEVKTQEYGEITEQQIKTPVGMLVQKWKKSREGNTSFLIEHPLKAEKDYKTLLWIEQHMLIVEDFSAANLFLQGDGKEGLSLGMLIPRGKSAFQSLIEHWVGTEELAYALVDSPSVVEELLEVMVQNDIKAAQIAAKSPYEYFVTWEDSSTQNYSPVQYKKYISREIKQWCEILAAKGKCYVQHACGHVAGLIRLMKEDGVFAVESISPPPTGNIALCEARKKVGNDFGIIGGIEPVHFLRLDIDELAVYTRKVIEDGKGGPFVLANSDSCPPGVTMEKFALVAHIATEYSL